MLILALIFSDHITNDAQLLSCCRCCIWL